MHVLWSLNKKAQNRNMDENLVVVIFSHKLSNFLGLELLNKYSSLTVTEIKYYLTIDNKQQYFIWKCIIDNIAAR